MAKIDRTRARLGTATRHIPATEMPVAGGQLITIMGVTYLHLVPPEGGDIYLTRFGLQLEPQLRLANWYEKQWFKLHSHRLEGTSAVFRVPTRVTAGRSLQLVVKNCRVGEDVPVNTHTLEEAVQAEFNSPWEEFSLVMEMREGVFGPSDFSLRTQHPLMIYVPPESMQLWQSGRSRDKMQRIQARNPCIELDILRQYKLIYGWIPGLDVIEFLTAAGLPRERLIEAATRIDQKVTGDMRTKGYLVADMKPQHIIIAERAAHELLAPAAAGNDCADDALRGLDWLIDSHAYSVVDYELLGRTPPHEVHARKRRRGNYLEELHRRHEDNTLPENLKLVEIGGIPYITGPVESTGGQLWVLGKNHRLFDFFLPERWRKTALWRLSRDVEISYTITKDGVHLLWTPSRMGETVSPRTSDGTQRHYNAPFEVFAILRRLSERGVATVAPRAIYMTGTTRSEPLEDPTVYDEHSEMGNKPLPPWLRADRNYLMLFGLYAWVGEGSTDHQPVPIPHPIGLEVAAEQGRLTATQAASYLSNIRVQVERAGFDAAPLTLDDLLFDLGDEEAVPLTPDGLPAVRLHDAELLVERS